MSRIQDKHGIPDPLTLRPRLFSEKVLVGTDYVDVVYRCSPVIDRAPKGTAMQWVMPPLEDPYPSDGRDYLECVSCFHQGSRWVHVDMMSRNRSRKTGYGPYCRHCDAKRKELERHLKREAK